MIESNKTTQQINEFTPERCAMNFQVSFQTHYIGWGVVRLGILWISSSVNGTDHHEWEISDILKILFQARYIEKYFGHSLWNSSEVNSTDPH